MEADFRRLRLRWRSEQRLEFLPDDAEGLIVFEERGVDLGKFLEDLSLFRDQFALLDEGPTT